MSEQANDVAQEITIRAGGATLHGDLIVPDGAHGIILFAHGSGSSRNSRRNRFVASSLNQGKMATLLFDLLTAEEEEVDLDTRQFRFDITLLSSRLASATDWLQQNAELSRLPVGYFGASTGGAAAIVAAVERNSVKAVVSRGGRPDLAGAYLNRILAPTLLIVGGNDAGVIELNQKAMAEMKNVKKLEIVPGATHLFEEPGALTEVSRLALLWFTQYL